MKRSEVLRSVMLSDAQRIRDACEQLDAEAFDEAIRLIGRAREIYVVGLRNCMPLAILLAYHLRLIFPGVRLLQTDDADGLLEQLLHITEKDVMIAISFPKYSMCTLKATEFANERKARVITITDEEFSPVNLYASCRLLAKSDPTGIADSLVAPMSLINALVAALYRYKKKRVLHTLETLEEIREDYRGYAADAEDLKEQLEKEIDHV